MSEAELPLGFNRMNRFRQSLPLSRSTSQTKLRSPGTPALPQPYCIRALGNATPAHSAALLIASMHWGVQPLPTVQHCLLHPCIVKCNPCPRCSTTPRTCEPSSCRDVSSPHCSLLALLPGVLFLQFGDETRRVHITHEISSMDTLHALIVHMFPQKLTMGMLKSPNTAILIKDESRNVFYELEDVR